MKHAPSQRSRRQLQAVIECKKLRSTCAVRCWSWRRQSIAWPRVWVYLPMNSLKWLGRLIHRATWAVRPPLWHCVVPGRISLILWALWLQVWVNCSNSSATHTELQHWLNIQVQATAVLATMSDCSCNHIWVHLPAVFYYGIIHLVIIMTSMNVGFSSSRWQSWRICHGHCFKNPIFHFFA